MKSYLNAKRHSADGILVTIYRLLLSPVSTRKTMSDDKKAFSSKKVKSFIK